MIQLPMNTETRQIEGVEQRVYNLRWKIYPQLPGVSVLQLPLVKYQRDGVTTHRFVLPEIHLNVRGLPLFIPPTMPVGYVALEYKLPHDWFLLTDEPQTLFLRIRAEGNMELAASQILRQIRSSEAMAFYSSDLIHEIAATTSEFTERVYQISFRPKQTGFVSMPSVRRQYFDTSSGKIRSTTDSLGWYIAVSPWMAYITFAVAVFIGVFFIARGWRWLSHRYSVYKLYKAGMYQFLCATSNEEIRLGLADIAQAEGWPRNITLADWLCRWQSRYDSPDGLAQSINKLQQQEYAHIDVPLDDIRDCLIEVCHQRMPMLRHHV